MPNVTKTTYTPAYPTCSRCEAASVANHWAVLMAWEACYCEAAECDAARRYALNDACRLGIVFG